MTFLDGKKTYVAGFAGAVYGILCTFSITPNRVTVWATIGSVAVIGVRGVLGKLVDSNKL